MTHTRYLTAEEAAEELGISRATLYAYVSRGMIRSEPMPGDPRARRYYREDVEKLKRRKQVRRDPSKSGEQVLHWGTPVLESSLTLIDAGRLYYRGRDALALAESATIEAVAGLLWSGDLDEGPRLFADRGVVRMPGSDELHREIAGLVPVERFQVLLPLAAATDVAGYDLRPSAVRRTGARILALLVSIAADGRRVENGIAVTLQRAWAPEDSTAVDLIDTALVLCADHELNVSSFTARCVASAGATPYAVVQAGLAALTGAKHGGVSERVEAFFNEAGTPDAVSAAVASRLRRGEPVPGFGHPLYPDGDPRAKLLLQHLRREYPASPAVVLAEAIIDEVRSVAGHEPNVDLALVALRRALGLPAGAALALFAVGRTVGWIAHAIEQYSADELIRPRARYVGEMPPDGNCS